jgi:hypothetical protein
MNEIGHLTGQLALLGLPSMMRHVGRGRCLSQAGFGRHGTFVVRQALRWPLTRRGARLCVYTMLPLVPDRRVGRLENVASGDTGLPSMPCSLDLWPPSFVRRRMCVRCNGVRQVQWSAPAARQGTTQGANSPYVVPRGPFDRARPVLIVRAKGLTMRGYRGPSCQGADATPAIVEQPDSAAVVTSNIFGVWLRHYVGSQHSMHAWNATSLTLNQIIASTTPIFAAKQPAAPEGSGVAATRVPPAE